MNSKDQSLLTSAPTKVDESGAPLFLGIDHTAIVVSDTERSLAFYRDVLGMKVAGGAENHGTEQEHLNQVFGARLRITALRAERGPGIEFLEYITPPGGRPLPTDAKANDLVFWHPRLLADDVSGLRDTLRHRQTPFVSRTANGGGAVAQAPRLRGLKLTGGTPVPPFIVRDPDGHALQIDPTATTALSSN